MAELKAQPYRYKARMNGLSWTPGAIGLGTVIWIAVATWPISIAEWIAILIVTIVSLSIVSIAAGVAGFEIALFTFGIVFLASNLGIAALTRIDDAWRTAYPGLYFGAGLGLALGPALSLRRFGEWDARPPKLVMVHRAEAVGSMLDRLTLGWGPGDMRSFALDQPDGASAVLDVADGRRSLVSLHAGPGAHGFLSVRALKPGVTGRLRVACGTVSAVVKAERTLDWESAKRVVTEYFVSGEVPAGFELVSGTNEARRAGQIHSKAELLYESRRS